MLDPNKKYNFTFQVILREDNNWKAKYGNAEFSVAMPGGCFLPGVFPLTFNFQALMDAAIQDYIEENKEDDRE